MTVANVNVIGGLLPPVIHLKENVIDLKSKLKVKTLGMIPYQRLNNLRYSERLRLLMRLGECGGCGENYNKLL